MPSVTNKPVPITPTSVSDEYDYVVGVDTHAATHSYAIVTAPTGALVMNGPSPPRQLGSLEPATGSPVAPVAT
ncbi:MAG: hypothetical protein H0X12_00195 [Nocardioides sp.]|nr:hypothetical protein [Nocardioides sp.]